MKYKFYIFLSALLFISLQAFTQKSQVQIARNTVGKLQVAIESKKDEKNQLSIIGEGIKAIENAQNDRRTKNWPETWAIKAYLSSYIAIIDEDETNSEKYYNIAIGAIDTAKKLDKYQDNSGLIAASAYNIIIKEQEKGNKAYTNNEFSAAFSLLKEVSNFFPKDTTLAINTGLAAQNIEAYDNVLFYFKRAKDNGVRNPVIFQSLSRIYTSKFENELAIKVLEDGLKANPYNIHLTNDYINLLLDNEKYDLATKTIENTLKIEPKNKTLHFLYGYLKQLNSDNAAAETAYKKALKEDPYYFDALYQIGITYINLANETLKSGKKQDFTAYINKSEFALSQAHEIDPNDKSTIQLLVDIYIRKHKFDKAQDLKRKLEEF